VLGREQILTVHTRQVPCAPDVEVRKIARATPGFSGADLANLVNEASLLAARANKRMVTMDDFEKARHDLIDELRRAPTRRLDNQITQMQNYAERLRLHAYVIDDAATRYRRVRALWRALLFLSFSALGVAVLATGIVLALPVLAVLAAAAVAIVLSACTVTISVVDSVDETVSAGTFTGGDLLAASSVDDVTLGGGEDIVYRVNVPSTSRDALYLYLDTELDLYVYRDSGTLYATSASEDFFAGGTAGLDVSAAGSALSPADVSANLACPGSCVLLPSGASDPIYVRIRNTSSFDQSVSFYAVLRDFEDTSEATAGLDDLPVGTTTGALETLGDVDAYEVQTAGTLFFDGTVVSGITFEAEIRDPLSPGSSARTLSSGDSDQVLAFEEVRVYAVNDRAAVAGKSLYFLELQ